MRTYYLIGFLILCLTIPPVCLGEQPAQAVNWSQLREAVASQKLAKRDVKVRLSAGDEVKSTLLRVEEESVVLVATRQTNKRWKATTSNNESRIPRADVTELEFPGRRGKMGLVGGLIGLGAGVGLAMLALANSEAEGVSALAGVLFIPAGVVGGYLIGNAANKPLPHFRIVP